MGAVVTRAAGFGTRKANDRTGPTQPKLCPCGSGRKYKSCCEVYHLGQRKAPDAETILRARYSAYSKYNVQFVADTYHPESHGDRQQLLKDIDSTCRSLDLHRLTILDRNLQPPEGLPEDRDILSYQYHFKVINQKGQKQRGNSLESHQSVDLFGRHDGGWLFIRELSPEEKAALTTSEKTNSQ